jgi:hypothetical protein
MRRRFFKRQRRALILTTVLAAILATGAYAYTTSISGIGSTPVGSGSAAIGTYTASNIVYTLDSTNPLNLNTVSFNLANVTATSTVKIQLASGGAWYSCTVGTPPAVSCDTRVGTQATAAGATQLTIAAAN